jgi:ABC-2 type transport system ATP-binding protein
MEHGRLIAIGKTAELARTAGLSIRLEIEVAVDDITTAQQTIRAQFTGLTSIIENNRLYVTGSVHDQIPQIVAALVTANVRIYRVDQQEASLEDIYFALHQKEAAT